MPRKKLNISTAEANKICRKLYGYDNCSFYSRYHTRVPGILDKLHGVKLTKRALSRSAETTVRRSSGSWKNREQSWRS